MTEINELLAPLSAMGSSMRGSGAVPEMTTEGREDGDALKMHGKTEPKGEEETVATGVARTVLTRVFTLQGRAGLHLDATDQVMEDVEPNGRGELEVQVAGSEETRGGAGAPILTGHLSWIMCQGTRGLGSGHGGGV